MADPVPDDGAQAAPDLLARLAADPLADLLGIVLEEVRPGYARAAMTVGPRLLNAVGTAHGGATMALLDVVHAAVSNSHGVVAVAQDVHTEFLAAGRPGDRLVAEGVERSEEHTSELQSRQYLVCRLLLEKKKQID